MYQFLDLPTQVLGIVYSFPLIVSCLVRADPQNMSPLSLEHTIPVSTLHGGWANVHKVAATTGAPEGLRSTRTQRRHTPLGPLCPWLLGCDHDEGDRHDNASIIAIDHSQEQVFYLVLWWFV